MKKEIGGYIEFEHYSGRQLHDDAIKLNCARNCLAYLIKAYDIKRIFIPYFLCDSVWKTCKKYGVEYSFYHIDETFLPIIPKADFSKDWLYVVNYYGQLSNDKIIELKRNIKNLIIDNVQAFFQTPEDNINTIYTCRKFFGVADGAYLYSNCRLEEKLETDVSFKRMNFLLGRFEKSAEEFYSEYVQNNEFFENEPIKNMSLITENLMRSFNYANVAQQRTNNFNYLHENLKSINELTLQIPYGAFAYPLKIENAATIKETLLRRKIYIPTLWPEVCDLCESEDLEYQYAQNILPLPVDQRYSKQEMDYLISNII